MWSNGYAGPLEEIDDLVAGCPSLAECIHWHSETSEGLQLHIELKFGSGDRNGR
jgi:hypothetical protein